MNQKIKLILVIFTLLSFHFHSHANKKIIDLNKGLTPWSADEVTVTEDLEAFSLTKLTLKTAINDPEVWNEMSQDYKRRLVSNSNFFINDSCIAQSEAYKVIKKESYVLEDAYIVKERHSKRWKVTVVFFNSLKYFSEMGRGRGIWGPYGVGDYDDIYLTCSFPDNTFENKDEITTNHIEKATDGVFVFKF